MKDLSKNIIFIIFYFYSIDYGDCICTQGMNCLDTSGFCRGNECVCINNFWTVNNQEQSSPFIYCNHKRYNRFLLLIMEFFLPTVGHFYAGKYYLGAFKLIFLLIPFLAFIIGFIFDFSKEEDQLIKNKKEDLEKEDDILNDSSDPSLASLNNLYVANREEKKVCFTTYLPVIVTLICLCLFIVIHIIDLICYSFAIYKDGYGAPLV